MPIQGGASCVPLALVAGLVWSLSCSPPASQGQSWAPWVLGADAATVPTHSHEVWESDFHSAHHHDVGTAHIQGVPCGHSQVHDQQLEQRRAFQEYRKRMLSPGDKPRRRQRQLQDAQAATIRITLVNQLNQSLPTAALDAAKSSINVAVRVIKKFVKISTPRTGNLFARPQLTVCGAATVPSSFSADAGTGVASTDYVMFVTADVSNAACQNGVIAFTLTCDYDVNTNRPTLGNVNLCNGAFGGDINTWAGGGGPGALRGMRRHLLTQGVDLMSDGVLPADATQGAGQSAGWEDMHEWDAGGEEEWLGASTADTEDAQQEGQVLHDEVAVTQLTAVMEDDVEDLVRVVNRDGPSTAKSHRRELAATSPKRPPPPQRKPPPPSRKPPSPPKARTPERSMQQTVAPPPVYPPPPSGIATSLGGQVTDALVHELVHGLGFHGSLFGDWIDPDTGAAYTSPVLVNGTAPVQSKPYAPAPPPMMGAVVPPGRIMYLATPLVQQQARSLFGCATLPGGQLENEGGPAQAIHHWEFRLYFQDLMTPLQLRGMRSRVTGMTLGALQDTGWYTPRWEYVQPMNGKMPKGCDLPTADCRAYQAKQPGQHYCRANDTANRLCASPTAPSVCGAMNRFTDGCQVLRPSVECTDPATAVATYMDITPAYPKTGRAYFGFGQLYGPASRCLPWTATAAAGAKVGGCFAVTCSKSIPQVSVRPDELNPKACPAGSVFRPGVTQPAGATLTCPVNAGNTTAMCQSVANPCKCVKGECLASGRCACDLEYMGALCNVHVTDVTDFDDP